MRVHWLIVVGSVLVAVPAAAQFHLAGASSQSKGDEMPMVPQQEVSPVLNSPGRVAQSSVGQIGQRQTRDIADAQAGIKPMARISNRIENRVENRSRTRIDRGYAPASNSTESFQVAQDQSSKAQ